jgi:hypothetical protein
MPVARSISTALSLCFSPNPFESGPASLIEKDNSQPTKRNREERMRH